ncbi:MAG TPA: UDP-N-acetylglucosamine pyrophosphorylase [bacterium]|nr:UDP-N-acetylglucosamine pyrophosphorylase [bacterium]
MNLIKPVAYKRIVQLIQKGVEIPNPSTIDIGDEVDLNLISSEGVKIYPGCRIYGGKTVISKRVKLGYESPATIDNCQLGPEVELKGGYFYNSVFLDKAKFGTGSQIRECCILEEESSGAHCVGLKQTILFPFVTLGSLINFCDCFMAGGTNRKNHSEVGSSYIHFNFTPDGNKSTASLIGDVPRGVMLNNSPIFLGGQGGMVGPLNIGYGNVIGAGSILREDIIDENKLVIPKTYSKIIKDFKPHNYKNLNNTIENNINYIANLSALEQWYIHIRKRFLSSYEFGTEICESAISILKSSKKERLNRLKINIDFIQSDAGLKTNLSAGFNKTAELFDSVIEDATISKLRDIFLERFGKSNNSDSKNYISVIQNLNSETSNAGSLWLESIINYYLKNSRVFFKI